MKHLITIFITLLAFATATAEARNEKKPVMIERDGLKVTWASPEWLDIEVDGIPFSNYSELHFTNKTWSHYFYGYNHDEFLFEKMTTETHKISFPLTGAYEEFMGEQTFELLPNRVLRSTLKGKLSIDEVSRMNYIFASVHPGWVSGCKYTVETGDGEIRNGVFPKIAPKLNLQTASIGKAIKSLKIDSLLGPITIRSTGEFPMSCLDYRNNAWDNPDYHLLLGVTDEYFQTMEPQEFTIEIEFPPVLKADKLDEKNAATFQVEDKDEVIAANEGWDMILPTPKALEWGTGRRTINDNLTVFLDIPATEYAASMDVVNRFHATIRESVASIKLAKSRQEADIVVSIKNDTVGHADGYKIQVEPTGQVIIEAEDLAGLDNAEKTLRQLIRKNGRGLTLRCATITDWPSLPFRGIHCFSGKGGLKTQTHFMNHIFPIMKINKLVYECSYLHWESVPILRNKLYGMPKDEARQIAALAQKQNIEIIPMVNTYGHSEWLLDYPEMKELADNPEAVYNYDATNPKVYELCGKIYDECIELFKPKMLHIGHDEIQGRNFPVREEGKKVGGANLILKDILHWHDFLKQRGLRTMMWGDMLLAFGESPDATNAKSLEEAEALRAKLPTDIIMTDWHYAPAAPELYKSLEIFNKAGFDTIAATWYTPENMLNFTREAGKQAAEPRTETEGKTMGLLQTTWAGYNFDDKAVNLSRIQFSCYILAAEFAWNAANVASDLLPYSYQEALTRLYGDSKLPNEARKGWSVDFGKAATVKMTDLGAADNIPSRGSQAERLFAEDKPFVGVPLAGCFHDFSKAKDELIVEVGDRSAKELLFVMSAPYSGSRMKPIAISNVLFDDGTSETIEWKNGVNVLSLNDHRDTPVLPTIARFVGRDGGPSASVNGFVWEVPKGETRKIRNITFKSTKTGPGLILYSLSGMQ